jgi:predicted dehydrogenase
MRYTITCLIASLVAVSHGFSSFAPKASFYVAPSTSPSALSMTVEKTDTRQNIRVGVIGMGRIGVVHLEAISKAPGVTPVIVQNPTISKAEAAAKTYNIPKVTSDPMDVITDPDVDAVWICSPSQFHAEQIKACAANKKHVFCEKPIATELTETVEAINACNEAGVKLMIGLQRRFDQNFMRVRSSVQSKEVGEPIMIKLTSRDPGPPPFSYVKGGGGLFCDMAVHDLDMSRFLAGTDPIELLATGSCHIDKSISELSGSEKYDTASCIVRYPDGVTAMIDVCRQSSFGYDQRAEVLGKKEQAKGKQTCAFKTRTAKTNNVYVPLNRYTGNDSDRQCLSQHSKDLQESLYGQCRHAVRFLLEPIQRSLRCRNHCLLQLSRQ